VPAAAAGCPGMLCRPLRSSVCQRYQTSNARPHPVSPGARHRTCRRTGCVALTALARIRMLQPRTATTTCTGPLTVRRRRQVPCFASLHPSRPTRQVPVAGRRKGLPWHRDRGSRWSFAALCSALGQQEESMQIQSEITKTAAAAGVTGAAPTSKAGAGFRHLCKPLRSRR